MGIFTDSSNSNKKSALAKLLIKYQTSVCISLYVIGIIYLCTLAHTSRNYATYFSENALLPGRMINFRSIQVQTIAPTVSK